MNSHPTDERSVLTHGIHSSNSRFAEAFELCRHRVILVDRIGDRKLENGLRIPDKLWYPLRNLLFSLDFARELCRTRGVDFFIIRELTNSTFSFMAPFLLPVRRRIAVIDNGNIQFGLKDEKNRKMVTKLLRFGFRFAYLELADGRQKLLDRQSSTAELVLPQVFNPSDYWKHRPIDKKSPVISIIGMFRADKSNAKMLQHLLDHRQSLPAGTKILLGSPRNSDVEPFIPKVDRYIDTQSSDGFVKAMRESDIVVLGYPQEEYEYRFSGIAANAIEQGAVVICPDYPIMRRLVSHPLPVGLVAAGMNDIGARIHEAVQRHEELRGNQPAFFDARSPARIAQVVDEYLDRIVARKEKGCAQPGKPN